MSKHTKEIIALAEKAVGKCPESGCIVKRDGFWRIISNKTGKLWAAKYKTRQDALNALKAYQVHK